VDDVISYRSEAPVATSTTTAPMETKTETTTSSMKPSFEIETVTAADGSNELKVIVTLPGCTSVKEFDVELEAQANGANVLVICATSLYIAPIKIQLPRNIVDQPRGSTFKRKLGKYTVRFPLVGAA
jgi:hypothetical protein